MSVKTDDVRLRITQQIAAKSKEADKNRVTMCQMLSTKDYNEGEACKLMDSLLLQYETVGMLKGELQMSQLVDSVLDEKTEKQPVTKAYF